MPNRYSIIYPSHLILSKLNKLPHLTIANQHILSIYWSGRCSGIIVDIGDGVASTANVYEGYTIPTAIRRGNFGGKEMTEYLMQLLREKGHSFTTSLDREIVKDIKEKVGYISMDYDQDIDKWESSVGTKNIDIEKKYKLPDGKVINLNVERFKCGEMLFKPQLFGIESKGVHEMIFEALYECDIDVRADLFRNVILSGGVTLMNGFVDRFSKELKELLRLKGVKRTDWRAKVVAPPERKNSTWIGGSILASLSTFQDMWITDEEYDEYGVNIVHRKTNF